MPKLSPFLWFDGQAEEAAAFYTSTFPNSRIERVNRSPGETPSGPEGSVLTATSNTNGAYILVPTGWSGPGDYGVLHGYLSNQLSTDAP